MWCKAAFEPVDGPTHAYMESTPGCWAAFGRVLAREYADPRCFEVHETVVRNWASQAWAAWSAHHLVVRSWANAT